MKEYRIETLNDLLQFEPDQLSRCLRDIEYAVNLHCLVYGVASKTIGMKALVWRDDGDHTIRLDDDKGDEVVTLRVIEGQP